jgi:hypothetical protein
MRISRSLYLIFLTVILIIYYLVAAVYLNNLGYYNHESLFYIEKTLIVFDGVGAALKGNGAHLAHDPLHGYLLFHLHQLYACTRAGIGHWHGMLFYVIAGTLIKRRDDDFFMYLLLAIFLFHPGILYTACIGQKHVPGTHLLLPVLPQPAQILPQQYHFPRIYCQYMPGNAHLLRL